MIEMATLIIIFDGIDFLVTMIHLRYGVKVYTEIQKKLPFIKIIKSKQKEMTQAYDLYDKVIQIKKKKSQPNVLMTRLYNYLMDVLENREERRVAKAERKQLKFKQRLDKHKKRKQDKKNDEDELALCAEGHVRCPHCGFYTSPEILLIDLALEAGKKAVLLQFSPEKVELLKSLILMPDKHKPSKVEDFEEFKRVFYHLKIVCRECKVVFDKTWKPNDIVHLQSKRAHQSTITLADQYDFVK